MLPPERCWRLGLSGARPTIGWSSEYLSTNAPQFGAETRADRASRRQTAAVLWLSSPRHRVARQQRNRWLASVSLQENQFAGSRCPPTGAMMTWCTSIASRLGLPRVANRHTSLLDRVQ